MFKVLSGEKKRRVISPATITASVAAHVLLLGGVVYAAGGEGNATGPVPMDTLVWDIAAPPPPPTPVEPTPPPPQPRQPDNSAPPRTGETLAIEPPAQPPEGVQPEDPGTKPIDVTQYSGQGPVGTVIGPPQPKPPVDPGPVGGGGGGGGDFIPDESMVEVRPVLERNGLGRTLERNYPPVLRDSRVSGRVVVQLIVDENGRPVAGSAQVLEASHPAFGEATLRAIDRFRFRPARMGGTPVPVRVTIPIVWTAQ